METLFVAWDFARWEVHMVVFHIIPGMGFIYHKWMLFSTIPKWIPKNGRLIVGLPTLLKWRVKYIGVPANHPF